jgi:hypothetical protein
MCHVWAKQNAYNIFVRKRPPGRTRSKGENNIELVFKEIRLREVGVDLIDLCKIVGFRRGWTEFFSIFCVITRRKIV